MDGVDTEKGNVSVRKRDKIRNDKLNYGGLQPSQKGFWRGIDETT